MNRIRTESFPSVTSPLQAPGEEYLQEVAVVLLEPPDAAIKDSTRQHE